MKRKLKLAGVVVFWYLASAASFALAIAVLILGGCLR